MTDFRDPRSFAVDLPDGAEVPNFCPEGCGGLTEDPYGGPCKACWRAVGRDDARQEWRY